MRILFKWTIYYQEDCKIGVDWYRHYHGNPYKGLTINFILLRRLLSVTFIKGYKEYKKYNAGREAKHQKWRKKMGFK